MKLEEATRISIILLAAGSSSRLGQSKQLVLVDGKTLLVKSALAALESGGERVIVVLGANASAHKKAIESLPVDFVINDEWAKGMGNSLKKGLNHLVSRYPQTEAVIIMVCDQPYLTGAHLITLITTYKKNRSELVASTYNQTLGVPALFNKSLFDQLLELDDAQGARKIIQHYKGNIDKVPFVHGEIDIDTPEDLQNMLSNN
jgi:molybdenum cofactor cytidylyltransferase